MLASRQSENGVRLQSRIVFISTTVGAPQNVGGHTVPVPLSVPVRLSCHFVPTQVGCVTFAPVPNPARKTTGVTFTSSQRPQLYCESTPMYPVGGLVS